MTARRRDPRLRIDRGRRTCGGRGSKRPFEPAGIVGSAFFRHAQARGLIVRAIGDTVALSPPLIITSDQVKELIKRFKLALEDTNESVRGHVS